MEVKTPIVAESLLDMLEKTAAAHRGATAIVWGSWRHTCADVDAAVQRMAHGLASHGVRRGDVVSVLTGNVPEMLVAHFAVPLLGAVLNTINTRLDAEAVSYILDHSGAKAVMADAPRAALAAEVATDNAAAFSVMHGPVPSLRRNWRDAVTDARPPIPLNYTSGTTGRPKGVILHHRGAFQNAQGNPGRSRCFTATAGVMAGP